MNIAAPEGRLAPNLQKKKMQLDRTQEFDLTFFYFGMTHPVVGGYTPEKVALRRAISLAFDTDEAIRAIYRGQALAAQSTVPPQAFGADPDLAGPLAEFNPAKAKALLDVYGYVDRDGDGYRELPDGSKLVLEIATTPDTQGKLLDELFHNFIHMVVSLQHRGGDFESFVIFVLLQQNHYVRDGGLLGSHALGSLSLYPNVLGRYLQEFRYALTNAVRHRTDLRRIED